VTLRLTAPRSKMQLPSGATRGCRLPPKLHKVASGAATCYSNLPTSSPGYRTLLGKCIAFLSCCCVPLGLAYALTVQRISFVELSKSADVIVQAIVESGATRTEIRDDTPRTCFTLRILKILKGNSRPYTELCFFGGTVGGTRFAIPGQFLLDEGKEGIFFLHDLRKDYLNPVVGWSQGLFYVVREGQQEFVTSARGNKIQSINLDRTPRILSNDDTVPLGVITEGNSSASAGMTLINLIAAIHQALLVP
jgi:hypothetical protein